MGDRWAQNLKLSRMSYNYNSRGRGQYYRGQTSSRTSGGRDPLKDLVEKPGATLQKPSGDANTRKTLSVEGVEYIGSYNWIEATEPTIIVPGMCLLFHQ